MLARIRHLPVLLSTSALLAVLAGLAGGLARGAGGALGAAVGVGVVAASYTFSILLIAWADSVDTNLVLPFGITAYITKFTLIGLVMAVVAASGWPGLQAMGWGVIAGVMVWSGTHIWWVVRHAPRAAHPEVRASDSSRPAAASEE